MQFIVIIAFLVCTLSLTSGYSYGRRWGSWRAGASSGGRSIGDRTSIDTKSDVRTDRWGSRAFSRGSGASSGRGRTAVDLTSTAGVGGIEGRSHAGGSAYGNRASSSAGANAVDASNRRLAIGASGAGSSVSTRGFGGASSYAGAEDNFSSVNFSSFGKGTGDLVASGSQTGAGLLNSRSSGKTNAFSRASGRRYSSVSTGARYQRD